MQFAFFYQLPFNLEYALHNVEIGSALLKIAGNAIEEEVPRDRPASSAKQVACACDSYQDNSVRDDVATEQSHY